MYTFVFGRDLVSGGYLVEMATVWGAWFVGGVGERERGGVGGNGNGNRNGYLDIDAFAADVREIWA